MPAPISRLGNADLSIMTYVNSASSGAYTPPIMVSGAELVASWSIDEEYVATKNAVVALNAYYGDGLPCGGDAGLIAANSVYWAYAWQQQPVIDAIDPEEGNNDGSVSVEISGDFFIYQNTEAALSGPTKAEIPANDIVVTDYQTIECNFDLEGADPGEYDLTITTPAGEMSLAGGFEVTEAGDDDDDDGSDDDDDDDDGCCCG